MSEESLEGEFEGYEGGEVLVYVSLPDRFLPPDVYTAMENGLEVLFTDFIAWL